LAIELVWLEKGGMYAYVVVDNLKQSNKVIF
jgi:hypothetical protein